MATPVFEHFKRGERVKGPGADEHYWQALQQGRLELQRCRQCDRWNWPAVWRCGECGSWEHAWHEVPLRGHIYSWTRTWHDFGAPENFKLPFVSVVIALDAADGRRLYGSLVETAEAEIRIGAAVSGEITSVDIEGETLPSLCWRIVKEPAAGI